MFYEAFGKGFLSKKASLKNGFAKRSLILVSNLTNGIFNQYDWSACASYS